MRLRLGFLAPATCVAAAVTVDGVCYQALWHMFHVQLHSREVGTARRVSLLSHLSCPRSEPAYNHHTYEIHYQGTGKVMIVRSQKLLNDRSPSVMFPSRMAYRVTARDASSIRYQGETYRIPVEDILADTALVRSRHPPLPSPPRHILRSAP
jgi:hypothetical protein